VNEENGEDKKRKKSESISIQIGPFQHVTFIADTYHIQTTYIIDKPVPFMEQILRKFKK
jgi:hypothetical protein